MDREVNSTPAIRSRRPRWVKWLTLGVFAGLALLAVAFGVERTLPLDAAYFQHRVTQSNFSFDRDQSSSSSRLFRGEAWGRPEGGVTYYLKFSTQGYARRCEVVEADVYLKPASQRGGGETPFVRLVFNGGETRAYQPSAAAAAAPDLVDGARKEFERLAVALTR